MMPAVEDLERRRPVWEVLSWLFLDTELDDGSYTQIAQVLRQSNYSLDELREILYRDLHPVLVWNMMPIAGEWRGFDLDALEARIRENSSRWWPGFPFTLITRGMIREPWQRVCMELDRLARGATPQ
jgi:hypothetical protein